MILDPGTKIKTRDDDSRSRDKKKIAWTPRCTLATVDRTVGRFGGGALGWTRSSLMAMSRSWLGGRSRAGSGGAVSMGSTFGVGGVSGRGSFTASVAA